MRVKDINSKETIQDLTDRGFYLYKGEQVGCQRDETYYCYFDGKKRSGNESPTILIDTFNGRIWFKQTTTYFMRPIPDVLIDMIQDGIIEKGEG